MTENEVIEILSLSPEMKEKLPNLNEVYEVAVKALEEIQQYRSIGTAEECREAMERQRAKKPIRIDMCTCPKCGTYNETLKKRRNTVNQDVVYCWHCGQAMEVNRSDTE